MTIIKINETTNYDKNRLCGPSKTKNKLAYSIAELRTIAKSLNIKPLPKTSLELCQAIKTKIKAQFGVDIVVTIQQGKAPVAAPKPKPTKPAKPAKPAKTPSATAGAVQFDLTVDCSKKGKDSLYTLADLKAKAKQLGIAVGKLNKVPLCEAIKSKLLAGAGTAKKTPTPVPPPYHPTPAAKKTPVPSPVAAASSSAKAHSPLGYIPHSDYVKIKPGLTFNMNVDCKGKKTVSNPNNYSKKDLQVFAQALGIKLKKNNHESCLAIKEKIQQLYKKPSPVKSDGGAPLEPTPTPAAPLSEKELMDAIRKCLKLKN